MYKIVTKTILITVRMPTKKLHCILFSLNISYLERRWCKKANVYNFLGYQYWFVWKNFWCCKKKIGPCSFKRCCSPSRNNQTMQLYYSEYSKVTCVGFFSVRECQCSYMLHITSFPSHSTLIIFFPVNILLRGSKIYFICL